jgi:hypothetical protein
VSLVLVSPSTLIWFHVRWTIGDSNPWSVAGATLASVRMTLSIVAMRGWIMPTPLATPETVTVTGPLGPAISSVVVASLIFVSVVIMAPATASRPASVAARWARGGSSRCGPSMGKRTPMTPVDTARVRSGSVTSSDASVLQTSAWSVSPSMPVAALAEPDVATIASAQPKRPPPLDFGGVEVGPRDLDRRGHDLVAS